MRERKAKMEELADAFLVVPGGIGTFEELFEVMTLKQLGRMDKPIAIYNFQNYYDELEHMIFCSMTGGLLRPIAACCIYCPPTGKNCSTTWKTCRRWG